jgi:hypothetical protein
MTLCHGVIVAISENRACSAVLTRQYPSSFMATSEMIEAKTQTIKSRGPPAPSRRGAATGHNPSGGDYADFRSGLAAGFFAAASFVGFLPAIGISISFWPLATLRGFLAGLESFAGSASPMRLRSAPSDLPRFRLRGRSFVVMVCLRASG